MNILICFSAVRVKDRYRVLSVMLSTALSCPSFSKGCHFHCHPLHSWYDSFLNEFATVVSGMFCQTSTCGEKLWPMNTAGWSELFFPVYQPINGRIFSVLLYAAREHSINVYFCATIKKSLATGIVFIIFFLLVWAYFHRKLLAFLHEHVRAFTLNVPSKQKYFKKYNFSFLVKYEQDNRWIIIKFSWNLVATNSKKSVRRIHERCFISRIS